MGEGFLSSFHFSEPLWLWALLFCIPVALWLLVMPGLGKNERLRNYADAHLMPYLLGRTETSPRARWKRYARWTAIWTLMVLAMAGPRWDFTDVQLFRPGTNLLVLFDISRSMDVTDVKPTRLARGRQELEDILNENRGIRVGLIAFASVAHVISPITEDMNGIRRVLSALDTRLVRLQGSRLSFALDRAKELIAGQPPESVNSLLIITDGDFDEAGLEEKLRAFADAGVRVHVLGVGTPEGGEVPGRNNSPLMGRNGQPVISALNVAELKALASAGGGIYETADYRDSDTRDILAEVKAAALPKSDKNERTRVWNERFYLLAGLAMLLLLPQFRRTLPSYRRSGE
jgi:Ca-activated chloride channel family protein